MSRPPPDLHSPITYYAPRPTITQARATLLDLLEERLDGTTALVRHTTSRFSEGVQLYGGFASR